MHKTCPKNDSQSGKLNAKKCKKQKEKKSIENANKMEKNDSRAGKVAFLEFPGRPRFSGLSRPPPRAISPRPRPPHPVFEPALHPEPGDNSSSRQAPLPYPSSPPASFPRVSALVPCIWCCHEVTKGLSW